VILLRPSARSILLRALHRAVWLTGAVLVILPVASARADQVLPLRSRSLSFATGAGQAATGTRVPAGAGAAAPGGAWHAAVQVPGTAALNQDGGNPSNANAGVTSVSCSQAADCAALGGYTDRSGYAQAFVVSES
jgi:hypothetical protein